MWFSIANIVIGLCNMVLLLVFLFKRKPVKKKVPMQVKRQQKKELTKQAKKANELLKFIDDFEVRL